MRTVVLHNSDHMQYPNLALMKIAAWHRAKGDAVQRFVPMLHSVLDGKKSILYSSKVFSWTQEDRHLPDAAIKGGTGYGLFATLPEKIEHICPDYDFYSVNYSLGFLTRGCIRSCEWCVVPKKEGAIRAHADIEEFCRHKDVKLMDNNVLAHPHGIEQIEKMARMDLRVDFNQGLDARLIDAPIARRLASLRWIRFIRLACDNRAQIPEVDKAIRLLRAADGYYREYFCYVLVTDVDDAHDRVLFLDRQNVTPFAQPYRDWLGTEPTLIQKCFAQWCNRPQIRKTTPWPQYWMQRQQRGKYCPKNKKVFGVTLSLLTELAI